MAIAAGASAVGLISAMPSGPGVIPDERIRDIASYVGDTAETFLLTSLTDPEAIEEQQRAMGTSALQLVDEAATDALQTLKSALPRVKLVQVIHVDGQSAINRALRAAQHADALLLDSGNPDLEIKELGGTGRRHDWQVSARIRSQTDLPVYLAGGLTPENLREAVETVVPYAVDVCSGLRNERFELDRDRLTRFADALAG